MHSRRALPIGIALLWSVVALLPHAAAQQRQGPTSPEVVAELDLLTRTAAPTAPVTLDGDALFQVRGISSYPAEQRAAAIAGRIKALAQDHRFNPEALRIVDTPASTNIMAGGVLIMGVFDADANIEGGLERQELALMYAQRIRSAIATYRHERSRPFLIAQAVRAAAATVVVLPLVALVWWLGRWGETVIERRYRQRI